MEQKTLFIGLTREVTFAGLPMPYLVLLVATTMIGFLISKSFIIAFGIGIPGYLALRGLAMYDPKIGGVWIISLRSTPITPSYLLGKGVVYRA